jgi:hypothetical protein
MIPSDTLDDLLIGWGAVKRTMPIPCDQRLSVMTRSLDALILTHQVDWNELKARYRRLCEAQKCR